MALSYLERCLVWGLRGLAWLLFAVFRLFGPRRPPGLPRLAPVSNPLLLLSGVQLARKIRRREVSCMEVVQAYIDRIQEVNPLINAMVKDRFPAALQEAAQVDRLVREESGDEDSLQDRLPLLGVPLSVKEAFALQGMPQTSGLLSRRGLITRCDASAVALLKRAGAIPLGVTNTSEVCMWLESSNWLYGTTNNPYSTDRIVGGSSGGEGCILGSAGSVIGIGSDIGGSIRLPAFFNGIFGHKPTPGIVPNEGQFPCASGLQNNFLCTGPMCRYAEDLLLMLRVMAGPNAQRLDLSSDVDLKKLRFFSVPHDGGSIFVSPIDMQLIEAQKKVVERLEADLEIKVQRVQIPQLKYSFQIWSAMMSEQDEEGRCPKSFTELLGDHGKPVWPFWELVKWTVRQSSHTLAAIGLAILERFQSAQPSQFVLQKKKELETQLEKMLGSDGVLLYPTYPHIAPKHHHPLFTPFNFAYTGIFNILGLPVTQCPVGLSREGLPLGLQVIANKHCDRLTIATAVHLEKATGGWRDPGAV
ncbi:fatty-acid amide hydrolase 2-B [Lepisosteus oculatus]|uniref:Fatty acid amide hydrolase 2b n=1 Tax=Lepisosteus oculatus TaxID=7918 RepID=W5MTA5_LEPOC|nr:PREDICTED: fatty-acid amide hydrolase 2 [Lepisosteus oculatus]